MFCIYCGAELPDKAVFCHKCGKETLKPQTETQNTCSLEASPEGAYEIPAAEEQTVIPAEASDVVNAAENAVFEKKKNTALPVIIMGAAFFVASVIGFILSINFQGIRALKNQGAPEYALMVQYAGITIGIVKLAIQNLIGAILFSVVCLIRKKHLDKIKMRDIIPVCLLAFFPLVFSKLSSTYTVLMIGRALGERALAGVSSADSVLNIVNLGVLVFWIGLSVFVLARTGAKVISAIVWAGVSCIAFVGSVLLFVFAYQVLQLMSVSEDIIEIGGHYLRFNAAFSFVPVCISLFFWWSWGSGKMWFVPACIYGPMMEILSFVLGTLGVFLTVHVFHLGFAYVGIGSELATLLGGAYVLVFTVIGLIVGRARKKS
ncbi:MAG: zinc-ribbon domain-containing protein [Clostridia bacterium]|nr:zinc-ribbon domain-containing protein [Clostridia bacterium]